MTPSQKAKWIAALRSGEYKQGTTVLYNNLNDTYCCLGVAQKICGIKSNRNWDLAVRTSGTFNTHVFISEARQIRLIKMNDDDNCSFSEIADYIEANIEPDEEDNNDTNSKT